MSRTKLITLGAIVMAIGVYLLPAGPAGPSQASAYDCSAGKTGTLNVRIVDTSTGNVISYPGTQVIFAPDPRDFVLDNVVVDTDIQDASAAQDRDQRPGHIRIENACSTTGSGPYTASIYSLPEELTECRIGDSDSTALAANATETLTVELDCTGVGPTPAVTSTPTSGPAATVQTSASPLAVLCNGTSVVNVQVRDAGGNPVQTGTAVTITTTLGTISPSSGFVTGSGGTVFTFFTAPATSGGTAVITAKAGNATGTANVSVTCGGTTVAPPPTVSGGTSGVITPPNTGDAGLPNAAQNEWLMAMTGVAALALLSLATWIQLRRP